MTNPESRDKGIKWDSIPTEIPEQSESEVDRSAEAAAYSREFLLPASSQHQPGCSQPASQRRLAQPAATASLSEDAAPRLGLCALG
jgi:hypothetical protein